jgi:16S rRNA U1498 N3-methylase RsmE
MLLTTVERTSYFKRVSQKRQVQIKINSTLWRNRETLKSVVQKNQSTTILIGPEGDFSEKKLRWQ